MALPKGKKGIGKVISIDFSAEDKGGYMLNKIQLIGPDSRTIYFYEKTTDSSSKFVVNEDCAWEVTHPGFGDKLDWVTCTSIINKTTGKVISTPDGLREYCIIMQNAWGHAIHITQLQHEQKISLGAEEQINSIYGINNLALRIGKQILQSAKELQIDELKKAHQ